MSEKNNYRSCMVNGKLAIFHEWIKDDTVLYLETPPMGPKRKQIIDEFLSSKAPIKIVPCFLETKTITTTKAIVEILKTGEICLVDPEMVRFTDTEDVYQSLTGCTKNEKSTSDFEHLNQMDRRIGLEWERQEIQKTLDKYRHRYVRLTEDGKNELYIKSVSDHDKDLILKYCNKQNIKVTFVGGNKK